MHTIRYLPEFKVWLSGIKDKETRMRLVKRLSKVALGKLGDCKTLGVGVYEMREHFGPGWRMYYTRLDETLIVMLCGGNKASQPRDTEKAFILANQIQA